MGRSVYGISNYKQFAKTDQTASRVKHCYHQNTTGPKQIGSFVLVHGSVKPTNDYEGSWLLCAPYSTLESINMCWTDIGGGIAVDVEWQNFLLHAQHICCACAGLCRRMKAYSGFVKTVTVGNQVQTNQTAVCKHRLDTAVCKHRLGLCLRGWHSRLICSTCAGSTEALLEQKMCVNNQ